jgi:hypothetical protein
MSRTFGIALAAAGVLLFGSVKASAAEDALTASDGYRISVLTMGPGDAFVARFGHDALLVERAGLPALVYNFGTYTDQAIALNHVLGGTLVYFLSVDYLERTLVAYRTQNRTVTEQVLALDQATAERLADALSENSLPVNVNYHYDFARDNCTTRVRDALDRVLGGELRRELSGPSSYTYRDHALRFTADDPALAFVFDVGLGKAADRPLDAWDDAFLPDRLAAYLRRATVSDVRGTHPVVLREKTLFSAKRAPVPERPPARGPFYALVGASVGTLVAALGRRSAWRVAFGLACAFVGAFVGALGVFVLLLLGTKVHAASHQNFNVLVCTPWALLLVPAGVRIGFAHEPGWRWVSFAAASSAVCAIAGTLAALGSGQAVQEVAALVVPLLAGVWLGVRRARRRV